MTHFFSHSRYLILGLIFCIIFFLVKNPAFAEEGSSCNIENSPIAELTDYKKNIDRELADLTAKNSANLCTNSARQMASKTIATAWTSIELFDIRASDMIYQVSLVANGDARSPVTRDGKIFDIIEKNIAKTADTLASRCALKDDAERTIIAMIRENRDLENTFKLTARGIPPVQSSDVRAENIGVFEAIRTGYTPAATFGCENQNKTNSEKSFDSLLNITDLGGKMDKALDAWRKAIAIFRGQSGTTGTAPTEYVAMQRRLLEQELSRQGLTQNMRATILKNFDCFKAKTSDPNQTEELLTARTECLSDPLLGVERLFTGWRTKLQNEQTTDRYLSTRTTMQSRTARTADVPTMYANLRPMIAHEMDINAETINTLVTLHTDLVTTNNMIEKRIKPMQKNCMKGNPSVVGGCAE